MFQCCFKKILYCWLTFFSITYIGTAMASNDIAQTLLDRISKSKQELTQLEQNIGKESRTLSKDLNSKQNQIAELREQAASAQRLIDEQLLSLDQLEARVEKWQTQSTYQAHLLNAYVEAVRLDKKNLPISEGKTIVDARSVSVARLDIENRLAPRWQTQTLVSTEGKMRDTPVLQVGPVHVGYDTNLETAGPLSIGTGLEARMLEVFNGTQQKYTQQLHNQDYGYLVFDPSLGNAYELMNNDDSLLNHLDKGGIWAFPIIVFGLLSLTIAIGKGVQLLRLPPIDPVLAEKIADITARDIGLTNSNEYQNTKDNVQPLLKNVGEAQARLAQIALDTPASQHRDDLMVAWLMEHKHRIERYMGVVATSAAVAPLLGLLGTVSGMISTFKMMTIFGSGDASTVSGGISEALVTTELGLIVAIPSLIVSALLTRKTRSYNHKLETFAIKLSKIQFDTQ